jgi:hypothetical protein
MSGVCPPIETGMLTRVLNCPTLSVATSGLRLERGNTGDSCKALVWGRAYQRAETH